MYKYVLFDLDGTLTNPEIGITNCVMYALEKFGVKENDRKKLHPFIGSPLTYSFRNFYGLSEEESKQAMISYALKISNNENKSDSVMVGDRNYDIWGAKEKGLDSIGVLFGFGDYEELTKAGATYIAETVEDILKYVDSETRG